MQEAVFYSLKQQLNRANVVHSYHQHTATRTIQDAEDQLHFPVEQILKTIVFRVRDQGYVLVGLTGHKRIDYKKLATGLGVSRASLSQVSPEEVMQAFAIGVGSVSPLLANERVPLVIDIGSPSVVYCGSGLPDHTIEIETQVLCEHTQALRAAISK